MSNCCQTQSSCWSGRQGVGRVELDALALGIYPKMNGHLSCLVVTWDLYLPPVFGEPPHLMRQIPPPTGELENARHSLCQTPLWMRVGNLSSAGQTTSQSPGAAASRSGRGCCGCCGWCRPTCTCVTTPSSGAMPSPLQTSLQEDFWPL